ncbi:MAG: LysE family transporter, partial [Pseudomonadota bacterium]
MPSLETLLPFLLAAAVFAFVPGPGLLYTAARTIAHGRGGGFRAAIGLHIGGYVHVGAAAFGLAALLALVPVAYTVLKTVGAAYLVWLGVRMALGQSTAALP